MKFFYFFLKNFTLNIKPTSITLHVLNIKVQNPRPNLYYPSMTGAKNKLFCLKLNDKNWIVW